jgi:murein DD-endopeptidase MepM/ murein hydrolase activator NlpD
LIIDTGNPAIGEANIPAAYKEYREKIPPLFATFDAERHWDGVFETPAAGKISTEFGTIRYTNGDYTKPRSHKGMDIAA